MAERWENCKVFVGRISPETTVLELMQYFSQFGTVVHANIPLVAAAGNPPKFGFVTFSKPSEASLALQHPDHQILGIKVDVKKAIRRVDQGNMIEDNLKRSKIFVGGLPTNVIDQDFKIYFERFGRVVDSVVIRDKNNNRPQGFGFIEFDSVEAADEALKNQFHIMNDKRVKVKKIVPKCANNVTNQSGSVGFQSPVYCNNMPYFQYTSVSGQMSPYLGYSYMVDAYGCYHLFKDGRLYAIHAPW